MNKQRSPCKQLIILSNNNNDQRHLILDAGKTDLLLAVCEIIDNVLRGNVKLSNRERDQLRRYRKSIRAMADRVVPHKYKKKLLVQRGGFLPLILAPALGAVAGLVGEVISKALSK